MSKMKLAEAMDLNEPRKKRRHVSFDDLPEDAAADMLKSFEMPEELGDPDDDEDEYDARQMLDDALVFYAVDGTWAAENMDEALAFVWRDGEWLMLDWEAWLDGNVVVDIAAMS